MAVLLGIYMGGMCLGSILLSRLVPMQTHPLRVYAAIETGIALFGLGVLFGMPGLNRLYAAGGGEGVGGGVLRAMCCAGGVWGPSLRMGRARAAVWRRVGG